MPPPYGADVKASRGAHIGKWHGIQTRSPKTDVAAVRNKGCVCSRRSRSVPSHIVASFPIIDVKTEHLRTLRFRMQSRSLFLIYTYILHVYNYNGAAQKDGGSVVTHLRPLTERWLPIVQQWHIKCQMLLCSQEGMDTAEWH